VSEVFAVKIIGNYLGGQLDYRSLTPSDALRRVL
jgi:hypothetical protein